MFRTCIRPKHLCLTLPVLASDCFFLVIVIPISLLQIPITALGVVLMDKSGRRPLTRKVIDLHNNNKNYNMKLTKSAKEIFHRFLYHTRKQLHTLTCLH